MNEKIGYGGGHPENRVVNTFPVRNDPHAGSHVSATGWPWA